LRRYAVSLLVLILAACGTAPLRDATPPPGAPAPPPTGGGYYKADGPGDNPPANLDAIPDAVPRAEPLHRFANRPYTVLGRAYVPATTLRTYRERGVASWYGRKFHGQKTSTGEAYDMYAMTAAHPTLPLPSYARVTNLANGRSVVVRVNDRGPFLHDRLIDLSYAAAYRLGIAQRGSGEVEVEAILPGAAPATLVAVASPTTSGAAQSASAPSTTKSPSDTAADVVPEATTRALAVASPPVGVDVPPQAAGEATPPAASSHSDTSIASSAARGALPPVAATPVVAEPAEIAVMSTRAPASVARAVASGYAVQLGAFASYPNAIDFLAHVQNQLASAQVEARVRQAGGLYRVYVGPYADRDEARRVGERITQAFGFATVVAPHAR
jgi:rare lipoprotein A